MATLELALLRRGVRQRDADRERCGRCRRTPLVGERMYLVDSGPPLCELCRSDQSAPPLQARQVRGPDFGRAIRLVEQPAA
jgi:hypothetical protein